MKTYETITPAHDIEVPADLDITQKEHLSKKDFDRIIRDLILPFIDLLNSCTLYPYQQQLAYGICLSILVNDGSELTAVQSRQSGKSHVIACVIFALAVLLPKFSSLFKDPTFDRFKNGFKVGIFGPDYQKAGIIYNRIKDHLYKEQAQQILQDKDIDIEVKKIKGLRFPNGSFIDLRTAGKGAKIEGATYDVIIIDESQDVDSYIIKRSLSPMLAWNNGNMIMIGTPVPEVCAFSEACYRNKLIDEKEKKTKSWGRNHYEFNWRYVAKYNKRYAKYIEGEKRKYGEHSDEFRMSYECEWIDAKGRFLSNDSLLSCGIRERRKDTANVVKRGADIKTTFSRPSGVQSYNHNDSDLVFAIDHAKDLDCTVITFAKVWWDNPVTVGDKDRFHIHILDWVEIEGLDHEEQHPRILEAISKFNVSMGMNDCTGAGDPIFSRLHSILAKQGIDFYGFHFNIASKDAGYKLLNQEIAAQRITFPDSDKVRTYKKHKKFMKELRELVKEYKNNYMSVRHPRGKNFHDDYADSLMILCWLVNEKGLRRIAIVDSPFGDIRNYANLPSALPNGKSRPKRRFWRS